jgi:hypothetical protein
MTDIDLFINLDDNFTIVDLVSNNEINLEEKNLNLNVQKTQLEVNNTSKIDINNKENNNIINSQPLSINNLNENHCFPNNTKKENTQSVYYGLKNLIKLCLDI